MTGGVSSSSKADYPAKSGHEHNPARSGTLVTTTAEPDAVTHPPAANHLALVAPALVTARITAVVATAMLILTQSRPAAATSSPPAIGLHEAASLVRPVAIFEPDDRRPLSNRNRYLRERIGVLVHTGTQSVCTAFCVAPDVVATAGHCVAGTVSEPADPPSQLRFRRDTARGPGISILGTNDEGMRRHTMTGALRLNTRPPINATSDWAFLRLSRAGCPSGGLRLSHRSAAGIAADAAAGRLYHVAYHRDLAHWKLAIARPCALVSPATAGESEQLSRDFERAEDLLLHTCDTDAASSGSPLLVDRGHEPEVVGINVGTYVRSRVVMHDGQIVQRLDSEVISNTALRASPLIAPLEAFTSGQLLTSTNEIEQLQGHLIAHGLHAGPRDGRYGPLTRKAIETYEARVGLPITGLATRSLLNRLATTTDVRAER